jgi:hypothetical protein
VIQLRIGDDDTLDRGMTDSHGDGSGQTVELISYVGRCVQEEPALTIHADGGGGLAPPAGAEGRQTCRAAGGTPAIPLRETPTCRGTEKNDMHWIA